MSHIFIKGNRWYISFRHRHKQYCLSLKIPSAVPRREVQQKIQNKFDFDLAMDRLDPAEYLRQRNDETTLYDFLDRLEQYYRKQRTGKTLESYLYSINKLREILKDIPVLKLTKSIADEIITTRLKDNYAYDSVIHHVSNFRTFFSKAVAWGIITHNPFSKLVPHRKRRSPHYYTESDIAKMKEYLKDRPPWQHDIVLLALNTGLRKGELVNLTWDQIDLLHEHFIIRGKGDQERLVPLNKHSKKIISKRPRNIGNNKLFWEIKNQQAINSAWRYLKEHTGISGSFHQLRKTYASYYTMNGGDLRDLMEILGHRDYATVLIYSGLSPDHLQRNKDLINF